MKESIVTVEHNTTHDGKHIYFVYAFEELEDIAFTTEDAAEMVREILERVNHKKKGV